MTGQETIDSSVRLVRWIKANDSKKCHVRQRTKVEELSRLPTIHLASNSQLTETILEQNNNEEQYTMSPQGSRWQYIEDVTIDEIELCLMPQMESNEFSGVSVNNPTGWPIT